MSVAIGVLLVFIIGLFIWKNLPASLVSNKNTPVVNNNGVPESSIEAGKQATNNLIDQTKQLADGKDPNKIAKVITVTRTDKNGSTTEEQAVVVAPQSNPISVDTGEVLTRDGKQVSDNATADGKRTGPLQSAPIADTSKLPGGTVKLLISAAGFSPSEFTVSAGQAVALSLTAKDSIEVFKFDSSLLSGVAVGLTPNETRAITFNAPDKIGEYVFYSDFGGHRQAGVVGKMIVK
jgi:plastocyanin